ncbi:MAG: hypothetical protein A2X86_01235 [Bdellovibrionales bacterium GWA2_49_15]|nr:MAG: hypothetical protein A2X86_01235 [Bdellovibrionales bacterium GWA2_49_15]
MSNSSIDLMASLKTGGLIMVPLLICSLLVWAVACAKWLSIRNFKKELALVSQKIPTLLSEKKIHEAKGLCQMVECLGPSMEAMLQGPGDNTEMWKSRVGRRLADAFADLRSSMWILGTIGPSAPFIGLFGTVVGIIKSFESIATTGKSGFNVVAGGLAEALVATAAGIMVAVMAVVLYNYFQTRFGELQARTRHLLEDFMDVMQENKQENTSREQVR